MTVTWFELEAEIRRNPNTVTRLDYYIEDQFLNSSLEMLRLYNGAASGWGEGRILAELAKMPATDLTVAAYEYFGRKYPEILETISNPLISEFFVRYKSPVLSTGAASSEQLLTAIKSLHKRKDEAYGSAWKKRGEFTSVLSNIARKVDRLAHFDLKGTELTDESVFDTTVDLFIYATKYILFLLERPGVRWQESLPKQSPVPFSDHVVNFDWLVDNMLHRGGENALIKETISQIIGAFEEMHDLAGSSSSIDRFKRAVKFRDLSFTLVEAFYRLNPMKLVTIC